MKKANEAKGKKVIKIDSDDSSLEVTDEEQETSKAAIAIEQPSPEQ